MISIGVRFRCALADAGYGLSAPFRQGLTARKLAWAVGIPRHSRCTPLGYSSFGQLLKVRGRPRKRHVPDSLSTAAEDMLASAQWRTVSWRSGTKGRPGSVCRRPCALLRRRLLLQRIWDKGQQHLPGRGLADRRAPRVGREEILSRQLGRRNGPPQLSCDDQGTMDLRAGPSTVEGGTGLDHFEGRSWHGLHRHALMAMIAYAFLQHRRLKKVRRGKRINGLPPQPTLPAVRHAIVDLIMQS